MDKTIGNNKTTISETADSSGNMAVKAAVAQWDSRPTVTGGEAVRRARAEVAGKTAEKGSRGHSNGVAERAAELGTAAVRETLTGGLNGGAEGRAAEVGAAAVSDMPKTARDGLDGSATQKDLVVNVEIDGSDEISLIELLKAVDVTCGRVLGCRTKAEKRWELTMGNPHGKNRLLDGFKIKNSRVIATEVIKDTRVVSFLNLPIYITDEQIKDKMSQWGVEPVSAIRRRKWAGTEVFDGTRFVKVRFPDDVSALPYSTKFNTLEGLEYFRVLHDNQVRVCRLCLQPGHILRDCPEFYCFRCHKQGHYARECSVLMEADAKRNNTGEMEEEEEGESDETGDSSDEMIAEGEESEQTEERKEPEKRKEVARSDGGAKAEQKRGETDNLNTDNDILTPFLTVARRISDASAVLTDTEEKDSSEGKRNRSRSAHRSGDQHSEALLPCKQPGLSKAGEGRHTDRWVIKDETGRGGKTVQTRRDKLKRRGREQKK